MYRSPRWLRFAPLVLGGLLCLATAPARADETCASAQCHAALLAKKTVHPATESCDACHEAIATPHPQKGKATFKLTAQPPELCANCHDAFGKMSTVHPPVAEGACTTCHDPHATDQPKLLTAPLKELCGTCHAEQLAAKLPHGPVSAGACTVCHSPHEANDPKLLEKSGDALCFDCHGEVQELLAKKNVHPAVESGCTSCHDPHGGAYPKLLAQQGPALCYQCHDTIANAVQKAVVAHPPVASEKACASCHSPHASDHEKLLLKSEKEVCLSCHAGVVTAAMTSLHGPIADGKCTACHQPHGSQNPQLLVASFPEAPYVPYTEAAFGLCFSCHERDLLQFPDTSFATNFRDGERNLHYLHVNNPQKGRSCKLCHALHGSDNDRLIAASVPFGQWTLPIKFAKTETGGSCAPGCHKPASYDRKNPVKKVSGSPGGN